jgi:hypothetical protein
MVGKLFSKSINHKKTLLPHFFTMLDGYFSFLVLANISLVSKFVDVKGSMCQVCVQEKQPWKSHKTTKERDLPPLELLH